MSHLVPILVVGLAFVNSVESFINRKYTHLCGNHYYMETFRVCEGHKRKIILPNSIALDPNRNRYPINHFRKLESKKVEDMTEEEVIHELESYYGRKPYYSRRREGFISPRHHHRGRDRGREKMDHVQKLESKKVEDMTEEEVMKVLESYYGRKPYYDRRREGFISPRHHHRGRDRGREKMDHVQKLESKKVEDMTEEEVMKVLESYYGRKPYYDRRREGFISPRHHHRGRDRGREKMDHVQKLESKKVEDMTDDEVMKVLESYYGRKPYYDRRRLHDVHQAEGENKKRPAFPNSFRKIMLTGRRVVLRDKCCKISCTAKEIYTICSYI
ncbi:uncharacterized protein LOC129695362 [Leucoraja erinacea]|uniref:uncharacterized protein LOC129695362 n=1 Tax=Leucoraja erinaceus TaxID=7782 RepID=UPI0024558183|nr:uncharacterized protein LOC129695362 [Leucoraja erinacea]